MFGKTSEKNGAEEEGANHNAASTGLSSEYIFRKMLSNSSYLVVVGECFAMCKAKEVTFLILSTITAGSCSPCARIAV